MREKGAVSRMKEGGNGSLHLCVHLLDWQVWEAIPPPAILGLYGRENKELHMVFVIITPLAPPSFGNALAVALLMWFWVSCQKQGCYDSLTVEWSFCASFYCPLCQGNIHRTRINIWICGLFLCISNPPSAATMFTCQIWRGQVQKNHNPII